MYMSERAPNISSMHLEHFLNVLISTLVVRNLKQRNLNVVFSFLNILKNQLFFSHKEFKSPLTFLIAFFNRFLLRVSLKSVRSKGQTLLIPKAPSSISFTSKSFWEDYVKLSTKGLAFTSFSAALAILCKQTLSGASLLNKERAKSYLIAKQNRALKPKKNKNNSKNLIKRNVVKKQICCYL